MTRSNSQCADKIVRYGVTGHGLDTVSLAWRGDAADGLIAALGSSHAKGVARIGAGGAYLETIAPGVTVGAYAGAGLAFIEGRLAPILSGDAEDRRLLPPLDLVEAQDEIWKRAADHFGLQLATPGSGVRRADLSTDVAFEDRCGTAVLDGMAATDPPRYKVVRYAQHGKTETVNLITAKRRVIVLRGYDKGVEQGTAPHGESLRFERPIRYGKQAQMSPERYSQEPHAKQHLSGLAPYAGQLESVRVVSPDRLAHELADLRRRGVISLGTQARLAGYAGVDRTSAPVTESDLRWWRRQRADLRALGLAVTPLMPDDAVLPLPSVLRDVAAAWE